MAVTNLNPGVGPTNADIATAVAAPSAATIASAVAAPSAATIAAAVAAPSAATIASAVAAPSSATIASAVAAAVPTLTQINNSVATNSSAPFGGTWVNLAVSSTNGVNGVTISSLSGYRYYRVYASCESMSGSNRLALRFNGDAGNNYSYFWGSMSPSGDVLRLHTQANLSPVLNGSKAVMIDIPSANSTATDKMFFTLAAASSSGAGGIAGGVWANTAAITSITFYDTQGNTGNWYVRVLGSN